MRQIIYAVFYGGTKEEFVAPAFTRDMDFDVVGWWQRNEWELREMGVTSLEYECVRGPGEFYLDHELNRGDDQR